MSEVEFDDFSRLMMAYAGSASLMLLGLLALGGLAYLAAYWIREFKGEN